MSKNSFKVDKSLLLRAQASFPTDPVEGVLVNQGGTYWLYKGGEWVDIAGGGGGLVPESISASATVDEGVHYLTDSSGGAFSLTLPAGEEGAVLRFSDATSSWSDNPVTLIPAAGESIDQGLADETIVLDVNDTWFQLMWDVSLGRWVSDDIFSGMRDGTTTIKVPKVTAWQSYSPVTQGLGTITSRLQWRQVGENVEIQGDFDAGTTNSSEAQIGLPNSYTISLRNATSPIVAGSCQRENSSSRIVVHSIATNGDTFLNLGYRTTTDGTTLNPTAGNDLLVNGERLSFSASIPVDEFAGDNAYDEVIINSGGGEGGGEYNYIANPYAETGTDNHTTSATTGSFVVGRTTDAAELPGTNPSAWTLSGSGVTVDDYVAIESKRAIANADTTVGTFEVSVVDVNGSLASDWKARLYDVDNSQYVGSEIEFQGTGTYPADAFTQPGVTYEIRMIAKVASPALVAAEFTLRSETTLLSNYDGPWEDVSADFVASNFGTIPSNSVNVIRKIQGSSYKYIGRFVSGTTAGSPSISIPALIPTAAKNNMIFGEFQSIYPGATTEALDNGRAGWLWCDGVENDKLFFSSFVGGTNLQKNQPAAVGYLVTFEFEVPAVELRNNVLPTVSDRLAQNASVSFDVPDGLSFPGGVISTFKPASMTGSGFTYNPTTGEITPQFTGRVFISASNRFTQFLDNVNFQLDNGTSIKELYSHTGPSSGDARAALTRFQGNSRYDVVAGVPFTIKLFVDDSTDTVGGSKSNYLTIDRISDTTTSLAGVPTSDSANDSKQYLLPEISTKTVALNGSFTGGNLVCTKIGNTVTITADGPPQHPALSVGSSNAGLIPEAYRPTVDVRINTGRDGTSSITTIIGADGSFNMASYNNSNSLQTRLNYGGWTPTISFVIT